MCHPASFVLTKDRVYWSLRTDSHTEIIAEHGLHEDGARGVNVAKVEIRPADGRLDSDPAGWRYKLDQDYTPDWYDAADCERRARVELVKWIEARVFTAGEHVVTDASCYASGSARVEAKGSSIVVARDSSRVVAWGSSSVVAWGSSSVEARGSSRVEARNSSSVEAWGSSRVEARESSSVEARGSSRVEAWDSSSVEALGSSTVEAWDSSRVEVACDHATVRHYGNSAPAKPVGPYAVVIDCRGDAAKVVVAQCGAV